MTDNWSTGLRERLLVTDAIRGTAGERDAAKVAARLREEHTARIDAEAAVQAEQRRQWSYTLRGAA